MKRKPQHVELIETALQGLQRTTGLAAQIIRWEQQPQTIHHDRHQFYAVIEIDAHGRKHKFAVEAKVGVMLEPRCLLKSRHCGLANNSLVFSLSRHTSQTTSQKSAGKSTFHFSTPLGMPIWTTTTSSFSLPAKKSHQAWPLHIQTEQTQRLG
jgi:hypothetical protein